MTDKTEPIPFEEAVRLIAEAAGCTSYDLGRKEVLFYIAGGLVCLFQTPYPIALDQSSIDMYIDQLRRAAKH